ncbi:uncharacterized protein K02A2.6-like [Podarcis raffonei]|uniref:uncharacterized protein K02A2.6-like n=1 Tax=Podarcis raffonei TaxID=65483 RepID=UPI002329949E|nr:uncharacterized protein K02A2.6-like [Podarcis raffonei]
MVLVDAYSKWLEVALMPSTTTEAVIRVLWGLLATQGCPDVLVLDNGPQFTSGTFERYLQGLGIRHALTAPFHPASNGQAERMVRSAKEALARLEQRDWHEQVTEYLHVQHITPHVATGWSPAELLMGRAAASGLCLTGCPRTLVWLSPRAVLRRHGPLFQGIRFLPRTLWGTFLGCQPR